VKPDNALFITHLRLSSFERQPVKWHEGSLVYATFANDLPYEEAANAPVIRVHMPMLGQPAGIFEVWRTIGGVSSGQMNAIHYSCNDDLLFGFIELSESDFIDKNGGVENSTPLQKCTNEAYRQIFSLIDKLEYPYLMRIWNYFPDINKESHGLERYRQFNIGRQEGFTDSGRSITDDVPAACALGTSSGPLTIYFIAGQNKPVRIENPRQISAFYYPQDYGPRTPTFSRASFGTVGKQEVLFISGTASIVGHQTLHIGDVVAQTRESLANIKAVVEEANRIKTGPHFDMANMSYKVYLRHPEHIDLIRNEIESLPGPDVSAIYLQGDICRQDLLVEIEALAGIPTETI